MRAHPRGLLVRHAGPAGDIMVLARVPRLVRAERGESKIRSKEQRAFLASMRVADDCEASSRLVPSPPCLARVVTPGAGEAVGSVEAHFVDRLDAHAIDVIARHHRMMIAEANSAQVGSRQSHTQLHVLGDTFHCGGPLRALSGSLRWRSDARRSMRAPRAWRMRQSWRAWASSSALAVNLGRMRGAVRCRCMRSASARGSRAQRHARWGVHARAGG